MRVVTKRCCCVEFYPVCPRELARQLLTASGSGGLFRTVENRDVFGGAYRDVFTAFLKRPPEHGAARVRQIEVRRV
jgi:hypothetical protein